MRKAVPALLALAAGCYAGPPRYYPGPPAAEAAPAPKSAPASAPVRATAPAPVAAPAPAPSAGPARMIAEPEAVAAATSYARSQGFAVGRVKHVHLDGAGRWHVDLVGERPQEKAKLLVDGWTGQVLKANLKDEED